MSNLSCNCPRVPLICSFDFVSTEVGYEDLLSDKMRDGGGSGGGSLTPPMTSRLMASSQCFPLRSPGTFENVPLYPRGGRGAVVAMGAAEGAVPPRGRSTSVGSYKLKIFTADRLNAGLGNTTVGESQRVHVKHSTAEASSEYLLSLSTLAQPLSPPCPPPYRCM